MSKTCTNCPGATDHDTAHCPLVAGKYLEDEIHEYVTGRRPAINLAAEQAERRVGPGINDIRRCIFNGKNADGSVPIDVSTATIRLT